jgi:hypothetical protein
LGFASIPNSGSGRERPSVSALGGEKRIQDNPTRKRGERLYKKRKGERTTLEGETRRKNNARRREKAKEQP